MLVSCQTCQKEFNKWPSQIREGHNDFCSRSCSAKFNNTGKQKNLPKERACKNCQVKFMRELKHKSTFLCRECLELYNNRSSYYKSCTLEQYHSRPSVKNKHPSWINSHVRSFARSWNKNLVQLPCQMCGYSLHIELCHIIPVSSFSPKDTLGKVNAPDNLLVLCRNHHWEFDNEIIVISDIPSRDAG